MVDCAFKDLPEIFGDVHLEIKRVAESIRKLALLVPPDDLYKNVSSDRLYQMAMEEADESERREKLAFKKLQNVGRSGDPPSLADSNRRYIRFSFWREFTECCLNQIEYLRAELIKRVGPTAIDQEEMSSFKGPGGGITEMNPTITSVSAVHFYIPKFRQLAQKLKDKKSN